MGYDAARLLGSVGDMGGWAHGVSQPTQPVTEIAGAAPAGGTITNKNTGSAQSVKVMHTMAAMVLVSIALLWISGTLVFKGARLP